MSRFHEKPNQFVKDIVLKVLDLEKSKVFYTEVMGFKVLNSDNKEVELTVDGINSIITLKQPKAVIEKLPNKTGLYHFAILLSSSVDLALFIKNLIDKQYPITGASDHGVSNAVYLNDPDNNGIEIYADTKSSTWLYQDGQINMTTRRLDIDAIIKKADDKSWKGLSSKTKIGHIHLHVADLKAAKKFYQEGLGYDLVASFPGQALFFSTGGYHHHVAVNIWNGKGVAPLALNSVGLDYFSIDFADATTRQKTIDNLKMLGYKITQEKDGYFTVDPSNNKIKLTV